MTMKIKHFLKVEEKRNFPRFRNGRLRVIPIGQGHLLFTPRFPQDARWLAKMMGGCVMASLG